jgi:hypothetical protein
MYLLARQPDAISPLEEEWLSALGKFWRQTRFTAAITFDNTWLTLRDLSLTSRCPRTRHSMRQTLDALQAYFKTVLESMR